MSEPGFIAMVFIVFLLGAALGAGYVLFKLVLGLWEHLWK